MKADTVFLLHNHGSCEKETDNGGLWHVPPWTDCLLSLSSSHMLVCEVLLDSGPPLLVPCSTGHMMLEEAASRPEGRQSFGHSPR